MEIGPGMLSPEAVAILKSSLRDRVSSGGWKIHWRQDVPESLCKTMQMEPRNAMGTSPSPQMPVQWESDVRVCVCVREYLCVCM